MLIRPTPTGTGYGCMQIVLVFVLVLARVCCVRAQATSGSVVEGTVVIAGQSPVATTDENFVCATMDWWPPEKCDYGTCSWANASLLRSDLKNPIFLNAIKAFSPLKVRLGGTLQDKLYYLTENEQQKPCNDFIQNASALFGFNQGCLPLARWDELNSFFAEAGALVIFGLDALRGKTIMPNSRAVGAWDPTNAASLIKYTVNKGYNIYGYELGNELSGRGVGVGIDANTYALDTLVLRNLLQDVYKDVNTTKPQLIAPGGFYDAQWFQQYLSKTMGALDVITHHIYNLGPGSDGRLIDRILDPSVLDGGGAVFRDLENTVRATNSRVDIWVGEAGGAYNSGRKGVSNTFVFGFWYLDQLGQASIHNTKTYCRQTLIGGNYGLLNTTTFVPNPDYYSALLWHRLIGKNVVSAYFNGTRRIRAYAHCAKKSEGVTLLLINIDKNTTFQMNVEFNGTSMYSYRHTSQVVSPGSTREEYHLTPSEGNVQSQVVLLNGEALTVDSSGRIPDLNPRTVNSSEPIRVDPYSIVFVHMPSVALPACKI